MEQPVTAEGGREFTCPKCDAVLDLEDVELGKQFKCQSCKKLVMLVPEDGSLPEGVSAVPRERGCATCLIPVVVLWAGFLLGMWFLWPSVQDGIELGFARVLETQGQAQESYRMELRSDRDADGIGEYVFFAEMPLLLDDANGDPERSEDDQTYGVRPDLKADVAKSGGIASLGAYSIILYFPNGGSSWIRDDGSAPTDVPQEVSDQRERAFVLYAVPNRPGFLGSRALVVDQGTLNEAGERVHTVFYCDNEQEEGTKPYSAENLPEHDAAYPTPRASLEHPLGSQEPWTASDGREWKPFELKEQ